MTQPWAFSGTPPSSPGDASILVEGSTFCVSDAGGDIRGGQHGLFVRDTRVLSRWLLEIDGAPPEPLSAQRPYPFHAVHLARGRSLTKGHESSLIVRRDRFVGNGMREDITVRNESAQPRACELTLYVESDFADLFEVKEGTGASAGGGIVVTSVLDGERRSVATRQDLRLECVVRCDGSPTFHDDGMRWALDVPPRASVRITVEVVPVDSGVAQPLRHPRGQPIEDAGPAVQLREWHARVPSLRTASPDLAAVLRRSVEDLGVLRIFDPAHPDRAVVAAGAPWFMALFGRDSLLTSTMLAPLDAALGVGTLQTLADHQGTSHDPATDEMPGRILHEIRFGPATAFALGGRSVYYGTADATALFVLLAGELLRWGNADSAVAALVAHIDRALEWITGPGDLNGDGFVEYQRGAPSGLLNQGWKDSWDGVTFADGQPAEPPIALAEVQGYSYAAFLARADLAEHLGDGTAERWREHAATLKHAFQQRFWLPDRGWYALGLDRHKRPIDSLTSNIGHCLWTGIADDDHAADIAAHLLSPALFSGWGIRTLATTMAAYNPVSYHNGSVWPHDTAIGVAGLRRYGFDAEAGLVAQALLDAAARFEHRLPELFCGFPRDEVAAPVPYPTACSPQAWSAAAPILLLTTLLGLEPDASAGTLRCRPALPAAYLPLTIDGLTVAGRRLSVEVSATGDATVRASADAMPGQ